MLSAPPALTVCVRVERCVENKVEEQALYTIAHALSGGCVAED